MAVNPDGILRKSQQVPPRRRQTAYTLQPQLLTGLIHLGNSGVSQFPEQEQKETSEH